MEAVRLIAVAGLRVAAEHIRRTVLGLPGAILGQIAFVLLRAAVGARQLGPAGVQVAALAGGAGGVAVQHAGLRVAAVVLAVLGQTAVALLARLHESIATLRRVKESCGLVPQAVVHAAREGNGQLIDAAAAPAHRHHSRAGGGHHALLVGADAVAGVVLHAEVVSHLVSHGGGNDGQHLAVQHAHAARVGVRADGTLQGFAHHAALERLLGQQLRIVVGMLQHQLGAAIVQEIVQRDVAVDGELNLVRLVPDNHAHQCNKDVQRLVELEWMKVRLAGMN